MHRYVAFLRGVNPMNARMAELRRCFETAGFTDVRTVLSSGNVAFGAPAKSDTALARIGNTKPLFPRHPFRPPPPAAAARAQLGLARLSALDRPLRMGEAEASSVSGAQGRDDVKRDCTGAKGRKTLPRRARRLWATLGWTSSNAQRSGRQRARAIGGGTEASLRWHRRRVSTDSWVMAAMMHREPRRQHGQVAIARANTRPSSLAQCQYGVPVFDSSPSPPCWCGVGMIAARSVLGGARQPAERTRCARGRATSAARFSRSSNGESFMPVVPSDQGRLQRSMRSPFASCSSRSSATAPLSV